MDNIKDSAIGLLAGINGGVASVIVGQPLDTIKVKLQTFPEVYPSAWKCFRVTLAKDGLLHGLYAGTSPALMANIAENAVLFGALPPCEKLVSWLCDVPEKNNLSVLQLAFAGSLASFWSSLALCPTELIKCKVQSLREMVELGQLGCDSKSIGPWSVTKSIFNERGLRGFTCGLSATFAREMPGYFFFFGGYETCRSLLTPPGGTKRDLNSLATIISGGVGGVMLWLSTFPFDVVKSRMQIGHVAAVQNTNNGSTTTSNIPSRNMLRVLFDITKTEGIGALYRGLGPTILRTFPCSGALFFTVEWTRDLFS